MKMTERKLFGANSLIKEFTDRLTLVEVSDDGWTIKYNNDLTNECWLKYVVDDRTSEVHLMSISPRPGTEELINIAFNSPFLDEIIAAACRLEIDEQQDRIEFREKLIDKLNEIDISAINSFEKARIKSIIQHSGLLHGINRRNVVGKHYTEIDSDSQFFKSISEKAQKIFDEL